MARTALNQLQEQIEAVRREAFAAGYAAAMQQVREFTAKSGEAGEGAPKARTGRRRSAAAAKAGSRSATSGSETAAADTGKRRGRPRGAATSGKRAGRGAGQRPQRGNNARLIEEVLQSNAPRALRPAEIRTALQRDKGVAMAFTSIRHALGQLEARRTAEQSADSKTWRYRGDAAGSG